MGHGTQDREELGDLLVGAGVAELVDVRRFPGSRRNADVARDALQLWLPAIGVAYRWEQRLGGRRSAPRGEPEPDTWWTVPAFRAYAAHTRTDEFRDALDGVLRAARERTVAVMCSETVWWRCHRRLVSDVAVLAREQPVGHLMPGGRVDPHRVAEGARLLRDGNVIWDGDPGVKEE